MLFWKLDLRTNRALTRDQTRTMLKSFIKLDPVKTSLKTVFVRMAKGVVIFIQKILDFLRWKRFITRNKMT